MGWGLSGGGKKTRDETSEARVVTATPEQRAGAGQSATFPSPARRLYFQFCSPGTLFLASRKLYVSERGLGEEPPEGETLWVTQGPSGTLFCSPDTEMGKNMPGVTEPTPKLSPSRRRPTNSTPTPHLPPCMLQRADWWAASTSRYGEGGTSLPQEPSPLAAGSEETLRGGRLFVPHIPPATHRPRDIYRHAPAHLSRSHSHTCTSDTCRHTRSCLCTPGLGDTVVPAGSVQLQVHLALRWGGEATEGSETSSHEKQAGAAAYPRSWGLREAEDQMA